MVTATVDRTTSYTGIVEDLRAIESRLRGVSRFDADAIEKVIAEIAGPEASGSRFYNGYRGVTRWL